MKKRKSAWPPAWTIKQLIDFLEKEAKTYRRGSVESIVRNCHMNELTVADFELIRDDKRMFARFADALLVDFINFVAEGQGRDWGLYVKHLKKRQ